MLATYELVLVRHAKAEERDGVVWPDDALRPLTARGREKMHEAAAGLRLVLPDVDWIVTSPLTRAAETADILAHCFLPRLPVEVCRELCPGGNFKALLAFLSQRSECRRIVLVGHETDLTLLAGELLGVRNSAAFGFRKGGCCLLEFEQWLAPGKGRLRWWLTPGLLRLLR